MELKTVITMCSMSFLGGIIVKNWWGVWRKERKQQKRAPIITMKNFQRDVSRKILSGKI